MIIPLLCKNIQIKQNQENNEGKMIHIIMNLNMKSTLIYDFFLFITKVLRSVNNYKITESILLTVRTCNKSMLLLFQIIY